MSIFIGSAQPSKTPSEKYERRIPLVDGFPSLVVACIYPPQTKYAVDRARHRLIAQEPSKYTYWGVNVLPLVRQGAILGSEASQDAKEDLRCLTEPLRFNLRLLQDEKTRTAAVEFFKRVFLPGIESLNKTYAGTFVIDLVKGWKKMTLEALDEKYQTLQLLPFGNKITKFVTAEKIAKINELCIPILESRAANLVIDVKTRMGELENVIEDLYNSFEQAREEMLMTHIVVKLPPATDVNGGIPPQQDKSVQPKASDNKEDLPPAPDGKGELLPAPDKKEPPSVPLIQAAPSSIPGNKGGKKK